VKDRIIDNGEVFTVEGCNCSIGRGHWTPTEWDSMPTELKLRLLDFSMKRISDLIERTIMGQRSDYGT
jgi:hypothetical protein